MRTKKSLFHTIVLCLFFTLALSHHSTSLSSSSTSTLQEAKTIKNPSTHGPEPAQRKKLTFKENLTIGVKEGDENYMFGESIYVNMDEQGFFYVTDWDRNHIRKFGPDGKYITTMGRPGQGP